MRTIVIKIDKINGKPLALAEINKGDTCWHYTFNKDTIVFNSKKEAIEICRFLKSEYKEYKFKTLNKKQAKVANIIKKDNHNYYMMLDLFLDIK